MHILKRRGVGRYLKYLTLAVIVPSIFIISEQAIAQQNKICSQPPHRIYFVRHAKKDRRERDTEFDKKVPLKKPCGFKMANELARELKSENISAIYTTEYLRTKQTAKTLADSIPLVPNIIEKNNISELEKVICTKNANKTILIVGHSDTDDDFLKIIDLEPKQIGYCDLFIVNYINGSPVLSRGTYCNYNELCRN